MDYFKHSLIFSSNLSDFNFLYKKLKKDYKYKSECYKAINFGEIPSLTISDNLLDNIKSDIHFLDYNITFQDIFSKLKILDKINEISSLEYKCPNCSSKLVQTNLDYFSNVIFKSYFNDVIALGIYDKEHSKIDIKSLLKQNIFHIIYNNKLYDIDELEKIDIKNYYHVLHKISVKDIAKLKEKLNDIYLKLKKDNLNIFVFSLSKNKLETFNLENNYICSNCLFETKDIKLEDARNVYYKNLNLHSILNTPFKELILKCENKEIKNILETLIFYDLGNFCFNSKIEDYNLSYILNYIYIKSKLNIDDILILETPLSFINKNTLENILKELKSYSTIIFENCEDIFNFNFDKVYKLSDGVKKSFSKEAKNSTLIKNKVNIFLKRDIDSIVKDVLENIESSKNNGLIADFSKVITIDPVFSKDTTIINALNIFSKINDIFLNTTDAKVLGLTRKDFLLKTSNQKLCQKCFGKGKIKEFNDIYKDCYKCNGSFFNEEILNLKFKNLSLKEVYNLNLKEALSFFDGFFKITEPLRLLVNLGVKDFKLNSSTLLLTSDIVNLINICSNFDRLQNSNLYIIKNAFSFLSISQKLRFIDVMQDYIKTDTIIVETV
ncbi:MAG: hypothetical protein ACOX3T_02600 [Bdellovibrionota bacterium]